MLAFLTSSPLLSKTEPVSTISPVHPFFKKWEYLEEDSCRYTWYSLKHVLHLSEAGFWLGRASVLNVVGISHHWNWGTETECRLCTGDLLPVCPPKFTPLLGAAVWSEIIAPLMKRGIPSRLHLPPRPTQGSTPHLPTDRLLSLAQDSFPLPCCQDSKVFGSTYFEQGSCLQARVGM